MVARRCDAGVTEVIGFVLIMVLVVIALSVMALVVPPMNGAEIEGELALGAVQEMADLKYDMDLLWEDSTVTPNVTRSVLIQLSTPRHGVVSMLPVFTPMIGSATLTAGVSGVTLNVNDSTKYDKLLRLSYTTSNNYAADSMVMYEAGAVFAGTSDFQLPVLVPSVGKSRDSLLIVLPRLAEGGETAVSSNNFGVVEYRLIDMSGISYTNPKMEINIGESEAAAGSLASLIGGMTLNEANTAWIIEKYPGTVKVMTANYSVVVRGAVP